MFGTDEKHPEDPPAYADSGASSSASLSDTSHGVTLTVNITPSGSYIPGSNLDAILSIPQDVLSGIVGDIECRLEGKSSVEIMGKPRYQLLNAGMGGSAMPITGREEHLFALSIQSSMPQPRMNFQIRIPDKRTCNCSHNSNVDFNRQTGEEESGIMPSLGTGMDGNLGGNRVTWKLKVEFKRKGVLKRDIKLSIEIPISLPPPPCSKIPLITNASRPLSDNSNLEATLTILPSPAIQQRQRIPFRLSFHPSPNPDLGDLKISVGLCKHTWTKGVETSLGSPEGHDFAGTIVGSLTLGSPRPGPGNIEWAQDGKEWVVEGEYEVGEGMKTVRGCGLRVSWSIQVQIRGKELGTPLVLSQAVHLPHYSAF